MPSNPLVPKPPTNGLSRRASWAGGEPIANVLMAKTLAHPELVSLAAGFVDHQSLPIELAQEAFQSLWSNPLTARAALQYGTTIGYPPLRDAILQRLIHGDGPARWPSGLPLDQVVITAGSNQFLALAADTLADPGDIVICGAPSYFVFLGTLANLGVRAVGVEIDQYGLVPEAIEAELARRRAAGELGRVKAIYVTTYYDNPSSVTLTAQRRAALVELARRWSIEHKIYLIEDAAYRELRYYGDDIPSLRSFDTEGDTVILAGSFSKSFSPGLRVGWGVSPPAIMRPLLAQKGNHDFGSPHLNQMLVATVLQLGLFDKHVERLRQQYRQKIDAILAALDEFLTPLGGVHWVRPTGGLYVWLALPDSIDTGLSGPLFDRAVEEGVLYIPGEYCYPAEGQPRKKNMIRLSFGIPSCESIRCGIAALGRAIRQVS